MKPENDRKISKFLSLLLRHKPEKLNLILDDEGYVEVKLLLKALRNNRWDTFTKEDLDRVVETNNKKRFAYSENGLRIRASQGHSINVNLGLASIKPPKFLYHGTVNKFLNAIKLEGLKKGSRQHVHLSIDEDTATNVGSRRGKPVILTINAEKMYQDGLKIFLSANKVWLTDFVPTEYVQWENISFSE
jgi:putative RNA 2'-phosphotransferase